MTDIQCAWVAGLFEGEGCISFTGKNSVSLSITSTDLDVLEQCKSFSNRGTIYGPIPFPDRKPQWKWQVGKAEEVKELLLNLSPFLGVRRKERASNALARLSLVRQEGFCKQGHVMTGDNLYVSPKGQRQCRTCLTRRAKQRRLHYQDLIRDKE